MDLLLCETMASGDEAWAAASAAAATGLPTWWGAAPAARTAALLVGRSKIQEGSRERQSLLSTPPALRKQRQLELASSGRRCEATRAAAVCCRVALTLEDSGRGVLRGGEALGAVAARLGALPGVEAVLLNCCAPQVRTWVRV